MRTPRPLHPLSALLLLCVLGATACFALWLGMASTAQAQDADFVIVVSPIEVESAEIATTVIQVSPGSKPVAALTVVVEFPPAVAPTVSEPLVSGFCEITDNSVRFSGFEVAGWSAPTDLCRITVRAIVASGGGTPTINISVAADTGTERLTGSTDPGQITVTAPSSPNRPPVVTATPEPTLEPTPEPTEEPTPVPEAPAPTPTPASSDTTSDPTEETSDGEDPDEEDPDEPSDATSNDTAATGSDDSDDRGRRNEEAGSPDNADDTAADPAAGSPDTAADPAAGGTAAEDTADDQARGPDTTDESQASDDATPAEPGSSPDPAAGDESASLEGDQTTAPTSGTPLPPLPAAGADRTPLLAGVTVALAAVGVLLGLGARKANRDPGLPQ